VSVQISGGGGEQDPLIGLKSKDLELREKRDQNDVMIDSQKLALEKEKTSLNAQLGQDRIQSTEEIAEARMAAAKEREAMRQSQQR
jgi:hypothetical protein